jgi:hypothetical protein
MLDSFRATGHEASAATQHGTASGAEDVEGAQDRISTVTENLGKETVEAEVLYDEALGGTDTNDIDAAESEAGQSDTIPAVVDVAEVVADGAEAAVDDAEAEVDTEFDSTDAAIDGVNGDAEYPDGDLSNRSAAAAKIDVAAKTNVEDEAKSANDAQHANNPESDHKQLGDQRPADQSEHYNLQVTDLHMIPSCMSEEVCTTFRRLRSPSHSSFVEPPLVLERQPLTNRFASTTPGRPELLCTTSPPALLDLKRSDLANIQRSEDLVRLSCVTLADLLWRTVIFANYFSDGSPTEIGLPCNFQFMPPEQQRFEIVVRESKLLGGRRPVPDHQAKVERDVLKFLSRVRQQSMIHIHELKGRIEI